MDMIKRIPTHMDYVGQGRAEKLYQIIIGSSSRIENNNLIVADSLIGLLLD